MNYHQPDPRWEIFGLNNFEQYETALVVKGQFHPIVPTDVVEAYQQAEYMMAFGYYHYPLYTEALSKILRIFEMAIKLKCDELKVDREDLTLSKMMGIVHQAALKKELRNRFDAVRSLRNHFMHPERHSYMGAMTHGYTVACVNLLNMIFLPEDFFVRCKQETKRMKALFRKFKSQLFILNIADGRFLVSLINIRTSIFINGNWLYVLYALPISENTALAFKNHNFLKPFCFMVEDLKLESDKIIMREAETKELIFFEKNSKDANQSKLEEQKNELKNLSNAEMYVYKMHNEIEIDRVENKFLLEYLQMVDKYDISA